MTTYTLAAGPWQGSGLDDLTISVSPVQAGDVLLLAIGVSDFSAVNASAVSGGGVTTWHVGQQGADLGFGGPVDLWWGVVVSTGSSVITVTNGSVNPSSDFTRLWAAEFAASPPGTWSVVTAGQLTGSGTAFDYPLLAGSGLYAGAAGNDFGTLSAGATSGVTYQVIDGHLMTAYHLAASGLQPAGVTNDGGSNIIAMGVLLAAAGGAVQSGAASLSASGSLSAQAGVAKVANAALAAAPALAAPGTVARTGHASFTASPVLTAAAVTMRPGQVLLTASPVLSAAAHVVRAGHAALTALPALTALGSLIRSGQAIFQAPGHLAGSALLIRRGQCALAAEATLKCSTLAVRITITPSTVSPGSQAYGPLVPDSYVVVPAVIDGIYDS